MEAGGLGEHHGDTEVTEVALRCGDAREVLRAMPAESVESVEHYRAFIASKAPVHARSGREAGPLHESLFAFQVAITRWAIRQGRAAIFADTGLGKTRMQIEWARQMGENVLIVAPLGVTAQTIDEAAALGVEVRYATEQPLKRAFWITNYERLQNFDPSAWDAIALDESSIMKSIAGKTRERLVRDWTVVPYRLCCTATPAPNDIAELANHSEFLGIMKRQDMLATWFVHDDPVNGWRLKGYARKPFFRWLASWAVYLGHPFDLGFVDDRFALPPLEIADHLVPVDWKPDRGMLFPQLIRGIQGRSVARRASLTARVARAVEHIQAARGQWIVWCGLNDEGRALKAALGDDALLIEGADSADTKLERERRWRRGDVPTLITKPTIFGYGMNWQHCHQVLFLGLGDSFEQYYQAIRRCWRFGQTHPVRVDIILSEAEGRIAENVWRKETEHKRTAEEVIECIGDIERQAIANDGEAPLDDYQTADADGIGWRMLLGDCVERLTEMESGSVGLSIHSPPFAQLYVYSGSPRDMGNCSNYDDFFEHYRFAVRELLRVTMPGRRACVHVQQVSMTKVKDDLIGWHDFRGEIVRLYISEGWIYHGEVVIDKDPQAQAIRTKSKSLLFVQKNKDSSWSIPAMADYILLFRAPGDNPNPVKTDVTNNEWILWARPVWYGIRETDTLQAPPKKNDDKHIAPLQLGTIDRCLRLWSNKGDLILDPMAGIGSVGYMALRHQRHFIGIELKLEYWRAAIRNLEAAPALDLFAFAEKRHDEALP